MNIISCPGCGKSITNTNSLCECGEDLTLLRQLDGVADAWYNRGVRAADAGDAGAALEWFSACCAARPSDVEARLAIARLWVHFNIWDDARRAAAQILEANPELEEARTLLAGLGPPRSGQLRANAGKNHRGRGRRK